MLGALNQLLATTNHLTLQKAKRIVSNFNKQYGTNFGIAPDMHVTTKLPVPDGMDAVKGHNTSSREEMNAVFAFLHQLFPNLKLAVYSQETFNRWKQINGYNMHAQAMIVGNTIVTSDTLRDIDVLAEEFLHPFMRMFEEQHPEAFNQLLSETEATFPSLVAQIRESYHNKSEQEQNQEIVTQALSRYFREEIRKKPNHNKFKQLVKKFIKWVQDLFDISPKGKSDFNKNKLGNRVIPIQDLNIKSLEELAMVLNTEGISFDTADGLSEQAE